MTVPKTFNPQKRGFAFHTLETLKRHQFDKAYTADLYESTMTVARLSMSDEENKGNDLDAETMENKDASDAGASTVVSDTGGAENGSNTEAAGGADAEVEAGDAQVAGLMHNGAGDAQVTGITDDLENVDVDADNAYLPALSASQKRRMRRKRQKNPAPA